MADRILRPGLLVSLKTKLTGNVSYSSTTLEGARRLRDGSTRSRWETERKIKDVVELERGTEARGKARTAVARPCSDSTFGLLCPADRIDELNQGVAEARRIEREFNDSAKLMSLEVSVLTGKIEANEEEALRAIASEVRDLIASMEEGIGNLDAKAVRKAADEARALAQMLTRDASDRMLTAIEAARSAARKITKAGENAAQAVDKATVAQLQRLRLSFLDFEEERELKAAAASGRGIDIDADSSPLPASANARRMEL